MSTPVPPEAVEAAMKASRSHVRRDDGARGTCIECGLKFTDWPSWHDHVVEAIAAAVVAALDLPAREREAAAKAELDLLAETVERFDLGHWTDADDVRGELHARRASALREEGQP